MKTFTVLALVALTIASAIAGGWEEGEGGIVAAGKKTIAGRNVHYNCVIYSGGHTKCRQTVTRGSVVADEFCETWNWGTGNGNGANGQCCETSDDCRDTCNGVVCGKSW
ncbi:hypothetical protein BGZ82_003310 [Podila clonocystis]|nr:hypothetical protein BGZ82_003310 [Podila clonocystis]